MLMMRNQWLIVIGAVLVVSSILSAATATDRQFEEWTLKRAVKVLNDSPWARQETFTRLIGGIGSGVRGEKEIYSTFFVRFLSAPPIRQAYARVKQIQSNYDRLSQDEREKFSKTLLPILNLDVHDWIVVAVSFRSNDPNMESRVRQFWRVQTAETLRHQAFLATERFPQIELIAYYPPLKEGVGAKFVFPRKVDGLPVVSPEDGEVTFELLQVPGANPHLRSIFSVPDMIVKGQLIL